jgi:molybdopterin molybdotransferase
MKGFFQLISSGQFLDLFSPFLPLADIALPLAECLGRVPVNDDLRAPEDLPPFSRSTMDGFAVRARDTFGCSESEPALLDIIGEIAMGRPGNELSLRPGTCAHIWTGGELPARADGVVMVEYTHLLDERTVEIFRPVAPGENVIRAGEDFSSGNPIMPARRMLRPQDLGVLAGLGITELKVHKRPRVGIISTGDELVEPDQPLASGKIRDINSTTLAALVTEAGAVPTCYGIFPDNLEMMLAACEQALNQNDILLLSGGSSVGRRDFTLQVLERIEGSELLAHGVAIRPGKPTLLARRGNQAIFGLPGHVASAMVVFYLFVRPLLRLFMGLDADHGLREIQARCAEQIPSAIGREEYVRVRLEKQPGQPLPLATPVYGKSGLLRPLVEADGLLVIGRDVEGQDRGSETQVLCFPEQ